MKRMIMVFMTLFLFFSLIVITPACAQTPESQEQIVWGVLTSENGNYFGVFAPESCDIFLLADVQQVLLPQRTNVYYWPITKEYKADWQSLDVPITGTMRVKNLKTGSVEMIQAVPYIIFTDVDTGRYILLSGDEATQRYDDYLARRKAYLDSVSEYDTLFSKYQKEKETNPNAEAPVYPEPFSEYLTAPDLGFVTSFKSGRYEITILDEGGAEVEGAKRFVDVIEPKKSDYSLVAIPERKWTYKQTIRPHEDVLYISRENENLYLQVQEARQYNEYAYTRFRAPQSIKGSRDRSIWVSGDFVNDVVIQYGNKEGVYKTGLQEYRVIQNSGAKLGYQILQRDSGDAKKADFSAFNIPVSKDDRTIVYSIADPKNDTVLSQNNKIVIVEKTFPVYSYLLILLPLAVFFTVKRLWK